MSRPSTSGRAVAALVCMPSWLALTLPGDCARRRARRLESVTPWLSIVSAHRNVVPQGLFVWCTAKPTFVLALAASILDNPQMDDARLVLSTEVLDPFHHNLECAVCFATLSAEYGL